MKKSLDILLSFNGGGRNNEIQFNRVWILFALFHRKYIITRSVFVTFTGQCTLIGHVTSAALFPPFFAQSERSSCVIYSINFNKRFQPFAILCHWRTINKKVAFYIGVLCHDGFCRPQARAATQNKFIPKIY